MFGGLLILGGLAGCMVFVMGLVLRRRRYIITGAPAVALILLWVVAAAWPRDAVKEFEDIFGSQWSSRVHNLRAGKPLLMDGFFLSFEVDKYSFSEMIREHFSGTAGSRESWAAFAARQTLPEGWPDGEQTESCAIYEGYPDGKLVRVLYLPDAGKAYATVFWESW